MAAPVDDMFSRCVDPAKASNCVEVRFIDNVKGKGLFAKRPFKKGDAIFIEQPLVSSQFLWNALYKYRALQPSILMQMKLSDGHMHRFEVPVGKFQELRYNVSLILKEMNDIEKRSILKIQD